MAVDKRFLDIGKEEGKIGTNKVIEDSASRVLVHLGAGQTFAGAKTLNVPGHSRAVPMTVTDTVSKNALTNITRCIGVPFDELLTITKDDMDNGYATLAAAVAPGQSESFKIIHYEGASALTLGLDFTLDADDEGDIRRFRWDSRPLGLGRPGRVIPGQQIDVRYNICKPAVPLLPDGFEMSDYWAIQKLNGSFFESFITWNKLLIATEHGGAEVTFKNIISGAEKSVTLPPLPDAPDAWISPYNFTVFKGVPIIYTLPQLTAIEHAYGGDYVSAPYLQGKFTVYASDWSAWGKVIEVAPPTELTSDIGKPILLNMGAPFCTVSQFGSEYLGLYTSWGFEGLDDNELTSEANKPRACVMLYDSNFQYVRTETLFADIIS